jgi:hypothetical protein
VLASLDQRRQFPLKEALFADLREACAPGPPRAVAARGGTAAAASG